MKKISKIKDYIRFYFGRLSREKIAIYICIPLSLLALTVCAVLLITSDRRDLKKDDNVNSDIQKTQSERMTYTYSSNDPYSLEFESLGNGQCAVTGIGGFSEKDLKIPLKSPSGEKVVEIRAKAFYDCDVLESVTIHSQIERIGTGAFRECSSLIHIGVDMENECFSSVNGVLFSKDKSRLIYYPPKRVNNKYYLNPNVKKIDDYAFEEAKNISLIYYSKGTSEFEKIDFGKGNDLLQTLPITCNYADGK